MKIVFIISTALLIVFCVTFGVYFIVKKMKQEEINRIALVVSILSIIISSFFSICSLFNNFQTTDEKVLTDNSFSQVQTSVSDSYAQTDETSSNSKFESSDTNVTTNAKLPAIKENDDGSSLKCSEKDGKWGYVDGEGNVVIPFIYDYADGFYDGFAAVRIDYSWGFINQNGKTVIPFEYAGAWSFINGLAPVYKDNLWGFINQNNELVIDYQYSNISKIGGAYYDENDKKIIY